LIPRHVLGAPGVRPGHSDMRSAEARLLLTMALNVMIAIALVIGGLAAVSLSLMSHALHNVGSVAALRWQDIDFEKQQIT